MQAQLALSQLNPSCQQVVLLIDVVGKFTDIIQLAVVPGIMVNGIKNAVNKWCNTHDERNLSTLFQVTAFVVADAQASFSHFLVLLFQKIV